MAMCPIYSACMIRMESSRAPTHHRRRCRFPMMPTRSGEQMMAAYLSLVPLRYSHFHFSHLHFASYFCLPKMRLWQGCVSRDGQRMAAACTCSAHEKSIDSFVLSRATLSTFLPRTNQNILQAKYFSSLKVCGIQ